MMRLERLRELKRVMHKMDFYPSGDQFHAVVNHGIETSKKLTEIAALVDQLDQAEPDAVPGLVSEMRTVLGKRS